MEPDTKRLFVTIRPPDSLNDLFHETQRQLQLRLTAMHVKKPGRVRWSSKDEMHITLVFSAAFSSGRVDALSEALAISASRSPAFEIRFAQPLTQPIFGRPKLILTPLEDGSAPLQQLHAGIRDDFDRIQPGSSAGNNRKYVPVLTLGRVSKGVSLGFARAIRRSVKAGVQPGPLWRASELELIESDLGFGSASYTVLRRFPLAVAP